MEGVLSSVRGIPQHPSFSSHAHPVLYRNLLEQAPVSSQSQNPFHALQPRTYTARRLTQPLARNERQTQGSATHDNELEPQTRL